MALSSKDTFDTPFLSAPFDLLCGNGTGPRHAGLFGPGCQIFVPLLTLLKSILPEEASSLKLHPEKNLILSPLQDQGVVNVIFFKGFSSGREFIYSGNWQHLNAEMGVGGWAEALFLSGPVSLCLHQNLILMLSQVYRTSFPSLLKGQCTGLIELTSAIISKHPERWWNSAIHSLFCIPSFLWKCLSKSRG